MASGRVHIRATGDAIHGNQAPDLQDEGPEFLLAHAISVTDVDVLVGQDETEPGIFMTVVIEDVTGTPTTIRVLLPLHTAEITAISLAMAIDAARSRART